MENHRYNGCGEIQGGLYSRFYYSAKNRGINFDVSVEYIWELFLKQDRKCALTGREIVFSPAVKRDKERTASLDRIDSSIGYIEGNVQWVHKQVNRMKQGFTNEELIGLCREVYLHTGLLEG